MKKIFISYICICAIALLVTFVLTVTGMARGASQTRDAEKAEDAARVLQNAIDSRDADLADRHIDFDALAASFMNDALPYLNQAVKDGNIRLDPTLSAIAASLNSGNLGAQKAGTLLLAGELRKFALYGVASGLFAGKPIPQAKIDEMDGGMFLRFGNVSANRKEFKAGTLLSSSAASARLRTSMYDQGGGNSYPLTLLLEKDGDIWKVAGLDNTEELLKFILHEGGSR